jgi:hypothetical protein
VYGHLAVEDQHERLWDQAVPNTLCLEHTLMTTIHWTNDFQAACAQADLDHRLILLDFFSPT